VTAPRVCRRCGAALSPNVMWCTLCYEPVRKLTPRDRQLPTPPDLVPIDPAEVRSDHVWIRVSKGTYSRTAGGATSFGVMGRVILTAFVLVALAGLASAAFLSFLVGGWLLGIVLIRDIWKKQYVPAQGADPAPVATPAAPVIHEGLPESARRRLGAPESRAEPCHVPTPTWLKVLRIVAVALYVSLAIAWQFTNDVVHACLLISGFLAALVLAFNWFRKV
jgi:hypothetical protein